MNNTPVKIQAHPPERRQRPVVVAPCCCCCCCCCCLHTLGGLTGAAMGSVVRSGHDRDAPMPTEEAYWARSPHMDRVDSERAAVRLYWNVLIVVGVLIGLGVTTFISNGRTDALGSHLLWTAALLLMFFPFVQFGAGLLAMLVIGSSTSGWFPDKGAAVGRIGKILLGMIVGTVAGIAVMTVLGLALSMLH